MTDLTPDHPAVEAAAREIYVHDAPSNDPQTWPPTPDALADDYRGAAIATLTAAREHYTADDLRDTPAGRALIAEGRGWTPATERDRRALAILNDPTVPAGTRHVLVTGIRLLHKLERLNER